MFIDWDDSFLYRCVMYFSSLHLMKRIQIGIFLMACFCFVFYSAILLYFLMLKGECTCEFNSIYCMPFVFFQYVYSFWAF